MTRLHVVGLPHTGLEDRFSWCAYTGKVRRFAPMMTRLGYDVTTYHAGLHEQRDSWHAGEHVCVLDEEQRAERFGDGLPVPTFSDSTFWEFNSRTIHEITQRIEPGDLVCIIAGLAQLPIVQAFPKNRACEFGVGYVGVIPEGTFRAFESYAWMHAVYGSQAGPGGLANHVGRNYDAVIPNYFDPADFPLRVSDDGYLLYLARCDSWLKGIDTARAVAETTGMRLVTAGAGPAPKGCDHRGIVGPAERAELLTHCTALIQPTAFLEPFGGSVVEALLSGVPVITTDWGGHVENVEDSRYGYRCRTLREFVDAVAAIKDEGTEWDDARQAFSQPRWSMDAVGPRFDRWFRQIADLDRAGWYQLDERGTDD